MIVSGRHPAFALVDVRTEGKHLVIAIAFAEHVLVLTRVLVIVVRLHAADSVYLLTFYVFVTESIFAIALIIILLAAEGIVWITRSRMLIHLAMFLFDTNFASSFKTLPAVEDAEIFWIVIARPVRHTRRNILAHIDYRSCCVGYCYLVTQYRMSHQTDQ